MGFRRSTAVLAAVAVVSAVAAAATAADRSTAQSAAKTKAGRLVSFGSCPALLGYAKAQAGKLVGPYGLGGNRAVALETLSPSAAGAADSGAAKSADSTPVQGVDYSGTNVQEQGVDEPDIVKTDGTTLFAVANGYVNAVDVTGAKPRVLDSMKLDNGWSHELLLYGDRLLVLSRGGYWAEPLPAASKLIAPWSPSQSVVYEVDVSDPAKLRLVRTLTLDGAYVAARLVGSTARIVASSQVPARLEFVAPKTPSTDALAAATAANRAVVASSKVAAWLPSYRITRKGAAAGKPHALVQCRDVRRPEGFSGLGMLTVLTVDVAKGLEPVDSTAVMTDARIVYASQAGLYVATERWAERPEANAPTDEQPGVTTQLHKFDISSPARTVYKGTGSVPGFLLSQWSLSEFGGVLRVVSTETPAWWGAGGESESFLTTLRERDGALVQTGRIGGLGKGERVYAVRFVGNTGYVVTFRQVDPLYTLDLSDADHPKVMGELEISGYSAYLHPIDDDLVIGVGQEADTTGRVQGTKVSLFDVSDLRSPKLLHNAPLGPGWSEAESDHHAFLYWPKTALLVIPFVQKAVGFHVARSQGIAQVGTVVHEPGELGYEPQIRRSLVVGNKVVTVSEAGVEASSLDTLAPQGWASFPARPPVPVPMPVEPAR
jgi:uncharacterized secreted protein with C-terminal beta-propeller domain